MDENARARDHEEHAVTAGQAWEFSHGHHREDWPDLLTEPCELAHDEFELLKGKAPGHRWEGWRRLAGDEAYFAACSCGWRSTGTGYVSPALGQVQDHLGAVRAMRGWGRTFPAAQVPHRDERERDAGQHEMRPGERARELCASLEGQQQRLAQAVARFSDLLAADEELADRRVAVLEREAARVEQEPTTASAQRAEALKGWLERAKELRKGIASASAAMAVVAEEITWIHQDLETGHEKATDWIYGERVMQSA